MTTDQLIIAGKNAVFAELQALSALQNALDESFARSVTLLFHSKGRIVVSGIGKSAIVAQKTVATFNSTGSPALYMHAADAIHGDLGMLQKDDAFICISKSGESPEIRVLVPLVKAMGNTVIGVTANLSSFLAKNADIALHTPIDTEADPNNLAPTASTTAQMALGDALAVCLLQLRGFTPADFAKFHPGGALGKQLYLRVSDLVRLHEKPAVYKTDSLRKVIAEMTSKRLGATAVLEENEGICGVITDGDLRRLLMRTETLSDITAEALMSPDAKKISINELAVSALQLMRTHNINQLLVTDEKDCYCGMVHLHDLIKEGLL